MIGILFEGIGDRQMEAFRGDPSNKGKVIDVGLWRYTRHPNYFGDACVWWGMFLVAAERWPGVLTIYAPIAMTLLLTKGIGRPHPREAHVVATRMGRLRRPDKRILPAAPQEARRRLSRARPPRAGREALTRHER